MKKINVGTDYIDKELTCTCGHPADEHYSDPGDNTSNIVCESVNNDGDFCPCENFIERTIEQFVN